MVGSRRWLLWRLNSDLNDDSLSCVMKVAPSNLPKHIFGEFSDFLVTYGVLVVWGEKHRQTPLFASLVPTDVKKHS